MLGPECMDMRSDEHKLEIVQVTNETLIFSDSVDAASSNGNKRGMSE